MYKAHFSKEMMNIDHSSQAHIWLQLCIVCTVNSLHMNEVTSHEFRSFSFYYWKQTSHEACPGQNWIISRLLNIKNPFEFIFIILECSFIKSYISSCIKWTQRWNILESKDMLVLEGHYLCLLCLSACARHDWLTTHSALEWIWMKGPVPSKRLLQHQRA